MLYRDGSGNAARITDGDTATQGVLTDAVTLFGLRKLTDSLPAYVNFTRNLLLNDFAYQFNPKDIVVQVMEDVRMDAELETKLRRLRQSEYTLALKNYIGQEQLRPCLPLFHIIRVDFLRTNFIFQRDAVRNHGAPGILFLADKLETEENFYAARKWGYALFQGYFFEKPLCLFKQLPPLSQTAYGKVLSVLLNVRPGQSWESACARIIRDDLMLSYLFRREEKAWNFTPGGLLTNTRASIYRMGPHALRHWTCLALMKQHNTGGNLDLVRRAYQRGLFMEALAVSIPPDPDTQSGNCFLIGVLSLLDKITGNSLEYLLRGMELPQPMRNALLGRGENNYTRLLQYVVIYEMGNERLIPPNIHSRLSRDEIVGLYLKCMSDTDAALARMEDSNK